MKIRYLAIATALSTATMLSTGAVLADEELATAKGCTACHQIETKVVGPAYKEVAAKYKDQEGAVELLIEKVTAGGTGTWGEIPMPPNAHVPAEDIKTIVEWIMTL